MTGTKQRTTRNNPFTNLQLTRHNRKNGGHARSRRLAGLSTFKKGEARLKHLNSWVAITRIDKIVGLIAKRRSCLLGRVIDITRGHKKRFAGFAILRPVQAAPHKFC